MFISTINELNNITIHDYLTIKKIQINAILDVNHIEKIFNCINLEKLIMLMSKEQFELYHNKFATFQKIVKIRIYEPHIVKMKGTDGLYKIPNTCIYENYYLISNLGKCISHTGVDKKCILCKLRLQILNNSEAKSINILNLNKNSYIILNNLSENLQYLKLPYIPTNKLPNLPFNLKELVIHIPKKLSVSHDKILSSIKLPFDCSLNFI